MIGTAMAATNYAVDGPTASFTGQTVTFAVAPNGLATVTVRPPTEALAARSRPRPSPGRVP